MIIWLWLTFLGHPVYIFFVKQMTSLKIAKANRRVGRPALRLPFEFSTVCLYRVAQTVSPYLIIISGTY